MNLLKGSLQDELDSFFRHIHGAEFEKRYVTKAAFCKARKNLSHTKFIETNHFLVQSFYDEIDYKTWNGFRLTAIDGSTLKLPSSEDISEHFGRRDPKEVPQARISSRYDVLNKICLELLVDPWYGDERHMAHKHLNQINEKDLVLYDTGYPYFSLYADHKKRNSQFVMRLAKNWSRETIDFENSNSVDKIIELNAHRPETKQRCMSNNVPTDPIKLRLLKVTLPTGKEEILITSLLDEVIYPRNIFKDLYALRWGVEEDYRTKKIWMEYENFTGKTVESVLQDIFAKVYTQNIAAIISFAAMQDVIELSRKRKHEYQVNKAQAISKLKNNLFRFTKRGAVKFVANLIKLFSITVEPVRSGRSEKRKHQFRKNVFTLSTKRLDRSKLKPMTLACAVVWGERERSSLLPN